MRPHDPRAQPVAGAHPGERGTAAPPSRALVVLPDLGRRGREQPAGAHPGPRSVEAQLAEAVSLAQAIGLDVLESLIVPLRSPTPGTLFGSGKVEEIAALVRINEAELVIVDHPVSPVQQRNLEEAWSAKVLDRTALILEIFGERAQTREGRLQVELAHLNYQKSRLVRSWTHLERQRGGFGFLGGPGETQIESDRRQIQTRIKRIEKDLEGVRNMRGVHRAKRQRAPSPVVALVGYTNAGKSSLFNQLTGAGILAENMLFATLDPTLRRVRLPHGEEIVLSDTVGFISELPTTLVAAFRATLEEVMEADLILHVRDIASLESAQQAEDVLKVLEELGINPGEDRRIVEVWNKVDLLEGSAREAVISKAATAEPAAVVVSATTGEGMHALLARIESAVLGGRPTLAVDLPPERSAAASWLYENTEIIERTDDPETGVARFRIRVPEKRMAAYQDWLRGSAAVAGRHDDPG